MKKLFLVGMMSSLALASCKKDENKPSVTTNYFPLAVGNYWVYNVYRTNLSTGKDSLIGTDSTYVKKDTLIKNQKYFILFDNSAFQSFSGLILRDSANCILENRNSESSIFLNSASFTDTVVKWHKSINNPMEKGSFIKMYKINNSIVVPSGNYNNIIDRRAVNILTQKSICNKDSVILSSYYANNVGLVYFNTYWTSEFLDCSYRTDFKLVRYKIN